MDNHYTDHPSRRALRSRVLAVAAATAAVAGGSLAAANPASADEYWGPYQYVNKASVTCLDDFHSSTIPYTPVDVWACNGTQAQAWTYDLSNDTMQVFGYCLDVHNGGTTAGTRVDLYPCNGTGSQVWQWVGNNNLYNPQSQKCLDDPSGTDVNGTQVQIWYCNNETPQVWVPEDHSSD